MSILWISKSCISYDQASAHWAGIKTQKFPFFLQFKALNHWIRANRKGSSLSSDWSTLLQLGYLWSCDLVPLQQILSLAITVNCSFYCWHHFHWAAIALDSSGCNAGCIAATCFSWSSVINTIPVAIRHLEHTVTLLFIHICFLISTAPWSLLEDTVIPRNLLLSVVTHLTELCTEIVTTLKPSSRKSCWWFGQPCVWLNCTATPNTIDSNTIRSTFQLTWDVSFILQTKVVDNRLLLIRFLF